MAYVKHLRIILMAYVKHLRIILMAYVKHLRIILKAYVKHLRIILMAYVKHLRIILMAYVKQHEENLMLFLGNVKCKSFLNAFLTLYLPIANLHYRALRIIYRDETSTFDELLKKDGSVTIHHMNTHAVAIALCVGDVTISFFAMQWPHMRTNIVN